MNASRSFSRPAVALIATGTPSPEGRRSMKPAFTSGLSDREGAGASYLNSGGLAGRIYSSLPLGQRDGGFIAVPAAFLYGCTDILWVY